MEQRRSKAEMKRASANVFDCFKDVYLAAANCETYPNIKEAVVKNWVATLHAVAKDTEWPIHALAFRLTQDASGLAALAKDMDSTWKREPLLGWMAREVSIPRYAAIYTESIVKHLNLFYEVIYNVDIHSTSPTITVETAATALYGLYNG